jgi:hypothetical protein
MLADPSEKRCKLHNIFNPFFSFFSLVCQVGYFPLTPFLDHMESYHCDADQQSKCFSHMSILNEIFQHKVYGMHQCLYCLYGTPDKANLAKHMIEHPSEFAFYCKREPPLSRESEEKVREWGV